MSFGRNPDSDREILKRLNDFDLFRMLKVNQYARRITNEDFWRNRLNERYPSTVSYKIDEGTWRDYYLNTVFYIDTLKNVYHFNYTRGNPKYIYDYISKYIHRPDIYSVRQELANLIRNGYEDIALYFANKLRENLKIKTGIILPTLFAGTPEWKAYKEILILN